MLWFVDATLFENTGWQWKVAMKSVHHQNIPVWAHGVHGDQSQEGSQVQLVSSVGEILKELLS